MSDVYSKTKRSQVMARIRSHGNKDTEVAMMKLFRRHRITGWRRRQTVFGKPDFVFRTVRLAVFVDGCFWHSCPRHATRPKNNRAFWQKKFRRNRERDLLVTRSLRRMGWRVLRIWEHELARRNESRLVRRLQRALFSKVSRQLA